MSRRSDQIASTLREAVQSVITRGLNDPRIRGLITVTGVDLSNDLRKARIHVSILPEEHTELTMHGIRSATRHIRRQVGDAVALRRVPDFEFVLDEALKRQANVLGAIAALHEETGTQADESPESTEPSESTRSTEGGSTDT